MAELKRRKVYHVAAVYVVVGLGILGAAELILDPLGLEAARPLIVILTLLGFPLSLVLAWAYEVRPEERSLAEQLDGEARPSSEGTRPAEAGAAALRKSIVVLPFVNMSPDAGDAYFSDGLTEEIITHLSYLQSLRVISRSSAMALRDSQKDVRTIGRELDVQYVLEGSVRKAGKDLRITAQLIDAITDEHLWAERYDGTLDDIFEMQEQTSLSIVEALNLKLNPGEQEKLTERPIDNAQAFDCLLKARGELFKGTEDGLQRARRDLEMGMEILGENELLLQGMAEVHLQTYEYGVKADEETLQRAEELAKRIMTLRPDSSISHYLKGRIERFRGSITGASMQHLKRAVALDPNHTGALVFLVVAYASHAGRPSSADDLAKRLVEIDPLTPLSVFVVGYYHWMAGRLEEALSAFQSALALEPEGTWTGVYLSYLLLWMGRREEALENLDEIIQSESQDYLTELGICLKCAL